MGWTKREPVSNLTSLGDGEGQVKKVAGLLASVQSDPNPKFKNFIYELVQKNGESLNLAGSASLTRQINETDVGHFIKCEFKGWANSPNGKFKQIEVHIYEGEPSADMRAWPRYAEIQRSLNPDAAPKSVDDGFGGNEEASEDDDLPF